MAVKSETQCSCDMSRLYTFKPIMVILDIGLVSLFGISTPDGTAWNGQDWIPVSVGVQISELKIEDRPLGEVAHPLIPWAERK